MAAPDDAAADRAHLRQELATLREQVEALAARLGPSEAGAAGGAASRIASTEQPIPQAAPEAHASLGQDIETEAARMATGLAANAASTERLKRELRDANAFAAVRFEAAVSVPGDGTMVWEHMGTLTRPGITAGARRIGRVLGALGSEARVRLLLLLWDGEQAAQALAAGTSLGTGSLYHHLRELLALRWVDSPRRNCYALTRTGRQVLVMAWALAQAAGPEAHV